LYDKVSEKVPTYKIYSIRGLVLNMTEVLRRYKMILIILGLSLVIAFLTFAILCKNLRKFLQEEFSFLRILLMKKAL